MKSDPRWQEWTDDDRRDRAAAKRAGFDDVDQWVDAIDDAAEILKEANDECGLDDASAA